MKSVCEVVPSPRSAASLIIFYDSELGDGILVSNKREDFVFPSLGIWVTEQEPRTDLNFHIPSCSCLGYPYIGKGSFIIWGENPNTTDTY